MVVLGIAALLAPEYGYHRSMPMNHGVWYPTGNQVLAEVRFTINPDGKTATVTVDPATMMASRNYTEKFSVMFFSADASKIPWPYEEKANLQYRVDGLIRNSWKGTLTFPIFPNGAYQVTCSREEPSRLSYPDIRITPLFIDNPTPGKTYTTYVVCQ